MSNLDFPLYRHAAGRILVLPPTGARRLLRPSGDIRNHVPGLVALQAAQYGA